MATGPGESDKGMSKEITPPPVIPSQDRPKKKSRLAVISFVFAMWSAFCIPGVIIFSGVDHERLSVICGASSQIAGALAFILGIVAVVRIWMSRGKVVGQGMAVGSICLGAICVLLLCPTPIVHHAPKSMIALGDLQDMRRAVEAYHIEYDRWPQPRSSGDLVLLFNGLRDPRTGEDISDKRPDLLAQNPRRIQFMGFRVKYVTPPGSSGKSAAGELAFYDPWGAPYAFAFHNGIGGIYYCGPGNKGATIWHDLKAGEKGIPLPLATSSNETDLIERTTRSSPMAQTVAPARPRAPATISEAGDKPERMFASCYACGFTSSPTTRMCRSFN